jgi:hypothetical protein
MKNVLKFNEFHRIFEASEKNKFFSFLGDYVDTDYFVNILYGRRGGQVSPYKKMQKYRNQESNYALNALHFIYQGGTKGRTSSDVRNYLQSLGHSGGGNLLYAGEWNEDNPIGSRRTGLFEAHCKKIDGRWVLTDKKLKKYFYVQDMVDQGATKDEIDRALQMQDLGIDITSSHSLDLDNIDLTKLDI